MADMKGMGVFIAAFVFLIVAVALVPIIADSTASATEVKVASNESVTIAAIGAVTSLGQNQLVSFTALYNSTDDEITSKNYTTSLDAGTVTVTEGIVGVYSATYTYREVGNGASRVFINLILLFFVLGVFLMFLGAISPSFREMMRI